MHFHQTSTKSAANAPATTQSARLLAARRHPGFDTHAQRTAWLAMELAKACGLSGETCSVTALAAQFHDIGKGSLPLDLLDQRDALSEHQRRAMQTHPELGARVIRYGSVCSIEDKRLCIHAAMFHHERWDGSGYPSGLAAAEIPEIARLVAVVDVFDALYSERPYKPAWPLRRCIDYIRSHAGSQFDPGFAAVFVTLASDLPGDWDKLALQPRAG